jgi:hypothetical protein
VEEGELQVQPDSKLKPEFQHLTGPLDRRGRPDRPERQQGSLVLKVRQERLETPDTLGEQDRQE